MTRFCSGHSWTITLQIALIVVTAALTTTGTAFAQSQVRAELVAVLPMETATALPTEVRLATDRIRIELLNTGKFAIVPPQQINDALKQYGAQGRDCTTPACATAVGKALSVRRAVIGSLARQDTNHWLVTASLVDVDTGYVLRASTVRSEGGSLSFINDAVAVVAARLAELPPPGDLLVSGKVVEQASAVPMVLAPPAAAVASAAPPPIYGCGPGGLLFKDSKNNYARFWAFLTNYTTWYAWVSSSTSGTSNCDSDHILKNEFEQQIFIAANLDALSEDMAQGQGPHVRALAQLMGCPTTLHARFASLSRDRYHDALGPTEAEWTAVWMDLRTESRRDTELATGCTRLS